MTRPSQLISDPNRCAARQGDFAEFKDNPQCVLDRGHTGPHLPPSAVEQLGGLARSRAFYDLHNELRHRSTLLAHDLAMDAKALIFSAQDAAGDEWRRANAAADVEARRLAEKIEKRLGRVRAELEALDRDVINARCKRGPVG